MIVLLRGMTKKELASRIHEIYLVDPKDGHEL